MLAEHLDDRAKLRQRRPEQRARGPLGRLRPGERRDDLRLGCGADPGMAAQLLGRGGSLQAVDRRDPELLPDAPRRLRPESREAHEGGDLLRHLGFALGQRMDLAVLDDLDDLRLDRLPDVLELHRLAVERELRDRESASRGCAMPPCDRRRSESRRRPRAPSDRPAGRTAPRVGHSAVRPQRAIIGAPMRATVCLPTYNERPNLEPMLRALERGSASRRPRTRDRRQLPRRHRRARRPARRASSRSSRCSTVRSKEGLGPAYLAGFARALADGAELILEMDCDFSHDPRDVPRLIAAAEGGADVVLGSRYVRGGSVGDWGLLRRAISRAHPSTPRSSCTWE